MPYIDKIQIGNTSYDIKDSTGGGGTVTGAYLPLAGGVMDNDAQVVFLDSSGDYSATLQSNVIEIIDPTNDTSIGSSGIDMTNTNS